MVTISKEAHAEVVFAYLDRCLEEGLIGRAEYMERCRQEALALALYRTEKLRKAQEMAEYVGTDPGPWDEGQPASTGPCACGRCGTCWRRTAPPQDDGEVESP